MKRRRKIEIAKSKGPQRDGAGFIHPAAAFPLAARAPAAGPAR